MNKRIRGMIDAIFCDMKMTAENLALRDELMANAQARYEDSIAQGMSEEEAFVQVASSLEDVQALLLEMNGKESEKEPEKAGEKKADPKIDVRINFTDEPFDEEEEEKAQAKPEDGASQPQTDLGDALNKAFTMLGDWGQSIMPQAKKLAKQMDDATGGMLRDIGRAVNKGMKDAQKAAGDVIDRMQQEKTVVSDSTPEEMREYAKDLRAQADLKRAVGDEAGADELSAQADALDTQADIEEQAEAMEQACRSAEEQTNQPQEESPFSAAPDAQETQEPEAASVYGADGELDEEAFAQSVERMSREAERIVREAGDALGSAAGKAGEALHDAVYGKNDPQNKEVRFPAAGLRKIDVGLDADDVTVEPVDGDEVIVRWAAKNVEGEPAAVLSGHTLTIRRKNPDVFKTFFSVFTKNGGQISICVPRGFAADYVIATTSGDVLLKGVDADNIKVTTSSGDMRLEPDLSVRAQSIQAETVSGNVTVSAMAADIDARSVSGEVFISCDAASVKADVVSGKLHIEGACDEWDVNAVSGAAELVCTVAPAGKINADTISGGVTLYLPGSIRGFVVDFESMSGTLSNEFGPDRYGTCALPIHLNTISGRMIIARL